jgi:predicted HTH domain antitoxin
MNTHPASFEVTIPEEFIPFLDKLSGDSMDQKVRLAFAVNLFTSKTVTLERATELSGLPLIDFMDVLKEQGIPWGEYTEEHKKQDDLVIKKMLKEIGQ